MVSQSDHEERKPVSSGASGGTSGVTVPASVGAAVEGESTGAAGACARRMPG